MRKIHGCFVVLLKGITDLFSRAHFPLNPAVVTRDQQLIYVEFGRQEKGMLKCYQFFLIYSKATVSPNIVI